MAGHVKGTVVRCIEPTLIDQGRAVADSMRDGGGLVDDIAIAGGPLDLNTTLSQLRVSVELHQTPVVKLFSHEGCGYAGALGVDDGDFSNTVEAVKQNFPKLKIETGYMDKSGNLRARK